MQHSVIFFALISLAFAQQHLQADPVGQGGNLNDPQHVAMQNPQLQQRIQEQNHPQQNLGGGAAADGHASHHRKGEWEPIPGEAIYDRAECQAEIDKYCPKLKDKRADIAVLLCIEGERKEDQYLSDACQHIMWQAKVNVTKDEKFYAAAQQFCSGELATYKDCEFHANAQIPAPGQFGGASSQNTPQQGHLVSCLLDFKGNMSQNGQCAAFLSRMEIIMFSDFHLVGRMVEECKEDVERTNCGRIDITQDHAHTQGSTIDCLLKEFVNEQSGVSHIKPLKPGCQREILRIAELQSEDFHLDRPLYFACRDDREQFCGSIRSGDGRVLGCLLGHRLDRGMSAQCAEKLLLKAQLMQEDYKAAHPLVRACNREIQLYRCVPPSRDPNQPYIAQPPHIYLSYVLLCIENAMHQNQPVNGECQGEVFNNRRILMSDYRISPEIVLNCAQEIRAFCKDMVAGGGQTIHCLMGAVKQHYGMVQQGQPQGNGFGSKCYQSISHLLKVADVSSDYRVDGVLERDCGSAIRKLCTKGEQSHFEVIGCLMDNVESQHIDGPCEARLMEVQYFMAREFQLDAPLYEACHTDAVDKCGADKTWADLNRVVPGIDGQAQGGVSGPKVDGLVLPCLYRHAYSDDPALKISDVCAAEVHRALRDRAVSVKLMPEIEQACLTDLSGFCSEKTGPGQEMYCLQENLEKLSTQCQTQVKMFSEREGKDEQLNRLLVRACKPALEKYCPDADTADIDSLDTMQCLVMYKEMPEMTPKCKAYVHHFQILSMKDYKISAKFEKACRKDIGEHCADMQNKAEIIACLSSVRFEHALAVEQNKKLSPDCAKQLKVEYLQEQEAPAELDPDFLKNCGKDIDKFCQNDANPMECVRGHKKRLSKPCRAYVFKHEVIQVGDQTLDAVLRTACRSEIKEFCRESKNDEIMDCLERNLEETSMGSSCRSVIERRLLESAGDIRLHPVLYKSCRNDIESYCKQELQELQKAGHEEDADAHDQVIRCLRSKYIDRQSHLHPTCTHAVQKIIYEAEINPELDPPFYDACEKEIARLCAEDVFKAGGHEGLMECVRAKFYEDRLVDNKCIVELRRRTDEELIDIHVDPGLFEACATDIRLRCKDIRSGQGRIVNCLIDLTRQTTIELEPKCRGKLEDRKRLWQKIYKDKLPMNFAEFASLVQESPAKNTFLTVAAVVVLCIFVFGLCFGRFTKRIRREMKMK